MNNSIGLDIGGTKIAGAMFDAEGRDLAQVSLPTPNTYETFLETCRVIVEELEAGGRASSIGACAPYTENCTNIPYLTGKDMQVDMEKLFGRPVSLDNDANCAALAEAMVGAGKGYTSVFGLIMGTGVGGGFVLGGQVLKGANSLCGEIGHLPLPFYEKSDDELVACGCGQKGCIEQFIAGAGLARLYQTQTGQKADAKQIGALAARGDAQALRVLDKYFTLVAKAMVVILHTFDPDIITVSGGLNALPGLFDEVPKRWGKFALCKNPKTKFVPAAFGATAGLHGAAWLGKNEPHKIN